MRIILLGKPGAGKGTQAKKLSKFYHIPHISTGEMFRQAYDEKTEMGILAHDKYWGDGNLVPDDITIKLVEERLQKKDCKKGFILDGFPRTVEQAKALDKMITIDYVVSLDAPDELCIKRIAGRRNCASCQKDYNIYFLPPKQENLCDICHHPLTQRKDDSEDVVKNRIGVYERQTSPLISYYQQRLTEIVDSGRKNVDQLFSEIAKKLDK